VDLPWAPVHRLFAVRAASSPRAVAVVAGREELSYGELAQQAGRLAGHLRRLGVGPEDLVGLALERSLDLVTAIVAVLAAGGAYLPLDTSYPAERLRYMWADAVGACRRRPQPPVLIGGAELAGLFEGRVRVLDPVRDARAIAAESASPALPEVLPGQLAYVIYTSGSTGRPKGVAVPHAGLPGVIAAAAEALEIGPGRRVLQLASIGFDASVLEIWTALSTGATLVLTARETLLSGAALGAELARRRISTIAIPPSLLERIESDGLPELRSIVVGAEACSLTTARRWGAGRRLVNAYAPTEATILATLHVCPDPPAEAPPLGRAIAGMEAHLLDREGRPVPPGEVGEICLGGRGLARGYLNHPELTAERFIPNPFAGLDGEGGALPAGAGGRLYRSGDLGRRRAGGELEFVGRADDQVKVRGNRVELGEIEAVLARQPGVRSAAVLAVAAGEAAGGSAGEAGGERAGKAGGESGGEVAGGSAGEAGGAEGGAANSGRSGAGDRRLVAYVVPAAPGASSPRQLRELLARELPEFMLPSAWVFLPEFPRTPTGKLDRRALPPPGRERPPLDCELVPPRNLLEASLAAIWSELLALDEVGVLDPLFELGGHSLLAAQIVSRVRERLGRELPLPVVFERPTVAGLAEYLSATAPGAAAAAGAVPGAPGEAAPTLDLPPIHRIPRDGPLSLSFAQERVWFLNQLAPGSVAYNFQFTIRFRGGLDVPLLARALSEVVRRHEVLRTSFPAVDGLPVQVIHPPHPVRVARVDLSGLPAPLREAWAERLTGEEIRRPFDVSRLPLLRWTVFELAPADHLLLQVEHHFVHDGWSLAVFLREVKEIYAALAAGRPSPLPEPPIQYADFAAWQRGWLRGEVLARELDHWRRLLAELPAPLELPADRPRPRTQSFRGDCLRVDLPRDLYESARAFGRRRGYTLFMTMLAVFEALVARTTGRRDLVLGSGLANRRLRESEAMIGMVVNTVVLRTVLAPGASFDELLRCVRAVTLDAQLHQDLPFEKLVQELQPDRDLSRLPIFQVLFSFHDAPVPDLDFAGLRGELFERHNGSAKTDLNVVAKPVAEQRVGRRLSGSEAMTMVWEFSGDLFDRSTVERMWGHFTTLLAGAVADPAAPGRRLEDLPLLTAAEREQLAALNDTAADAADAGAHGGPAGSGPAAEDAGPAPAAELPVHLQFAAWAARCPEALAVAAGPVELTYGELARRAGELARVLSGLGVGRESVVALLTERSPEMVVASLAVLATGGAWLPLDPSYPPERLAFMLADSGARAVLVRDELRAALPAGLALPVLSLDARREAGGEAAEKESAGTAGAASGVEDGPAGSNWSPGGGRHGAVVSARSPAGRVAAAGPADGFAAEVAPGQLAYVIYTSGSTGRPKGVEVSHAGLANLVRWHRAAYEVGPEARASVLAGPAFDASVWEVWPYLAAGASLHVPAAAERSQPPLLLGWLASAGITHAFLPTPLAEAVLEEPLPAGLVLRFLLTGGDRLRHAPQRELPFRLLNHYGPTENSVVSTVAPVASGAAAAPPIGRPIARTRVHVVDRELRRLPAGVPGELLVGGASLARGYLGRPGLTAEKFLPDPWGGPGERLYRTGDLVRLLPAGLELDFLGRLDSQVKVRGFRIELGEIETLLAQQAAVRQAVVAARRDVGVGAGVGVGVGAGTGGGAGTRLVAYVVPAVEGGDEAALVALEAALRTRLAASLPEHMLPAAFVFLAALPLTANGKVDLAALPEPAAGPAASTAWAGPRTPLEELLCGLWERTIGVAPIGIHESFWKLGGHSLLAAQVLARVRDALRVEVPLAALFAAPTVAELAAVVEDLLRGSTRAAAGIPRRHDRGPAPLSFAQERLWFLDQLAPGNSAYHIARAFDVAGPLAPAVLAAALRAMLDRHETLRGRCELAGELPVERIVPASAPVLPVVDLAALPAAPAGSAAERVAAEHVRRPFDLARDARLRAVLLRLPASERDGDRAGSMLPAAAVEVAEAKAAEAAAVEAAVTPAPASPGPEHRLLLTLHHIASDGWSMGLLFRELGAAYEALLAGGTPPLLELPIQYADYAVWQRQRLAGGPLDELAAYWGGQLAGAPGLLELPTDRPRPPVQGFRGAQETVEVDGETWSAAKGLARSSGVTSFMALLAACAALLGRQSGQDDLVVGSPVAGRVHSALEDLIGFFVNTLALRLRLAADPSFGELLVQAREVTLGAFAHQEMPFEKLVEQLAPERNLAHSPLVQALLAPPAGAPERLALGGAEVAPRPLPRRESRFDLEVGIVERAEPDAGAAASLLLVLRYDSDLFDAATIVRLGGRLALLLAVAAADPGRRLSEIPLLTASERQELARWERGGEWEEVAERTDAPTGSDGEVEGAGRPRAAAGSPDREAAPAAWRPVHRLVEEQAARAPHALAVAAGELRLSYGELDRRAGRVAARLRALGAGAESCVALLTERTPAAVVGALAALKAGAAYLPLDPAHPAERLAFMLSDARAAVLVRAGGLALEVAPAGLPVVALDAGGEIADFGATVAGGAGVVDAAGAADAADTEDAADAVQTAHGAHAADGTETAQIAHETEAAWDPPGEALAYVIYTSGSTGQPKGVELTHAGLANLVGWHRRAYAVTAADRAPLLAGPAFDAAVWETWPYLAAGASLHIPDAETRAEPERLLGWMAATGITLAFLATPLAEAVLVEAPPAGLALRALLTGGDRLRRRPPHGRPYVLFNHYGPTESTVVTTCGEAMPDGPAPPPIGRPLAGLAVRLLDRWLQPVPPGAAGELCVGGLGVARGYRGRPELTAERFVPDPAAAAPGARLYRTGDLARFRAGGELEFIRRLDTQVKIRGFRVELGEIEAALGGHPAIQDAAVLLRSDPVPGGGAAPGAGGGRERLAGYLVPRAGAALPAAAELAAWLAQRLPAFMVPAAFVELRALPLTPNGKIDRRALPAPSWGSGAEGAGSPPPSTPEERLVAGIWRDVLGLERVGVEDQFFHLGGQSLLATQVMARLRRELALDLPLRTLFQAPTVGALARAIVEARAAAEAAPLAPPPPPRIPVVRRVARARPRA
jgi:amino acid adenylation domain-containing protein